MFVQRANFLASEQLIPSHRYPNLNYLAHVPLFISSGKWLPVNMASLLLAHTMETRICSWRESMCTLQRPSGASTFPGQCWLTWSQELWTLSRREQWGICSDRTTLSLVWEDVCCVVVVLFRMGGRWNKREGEEAYWKRGFLDGKALQCS